MKKIPRFFLLFLSCSLIAMGSLLMLLQSSWMKGQVIEVLRSYASQMGMQLSIQDMEGKLPLSWKFHHVQLIFPEEEKADMDQVELSIALLPLLKGEIKIDTLYAHHIHFTYSPHALNSSSSYQSYLDHSFSIRHFNIEQINVLNQVTQEKNSYSLRGHGKWVKNERLSLAFSLESFESNLKISLEGLPQLNHFFAHCKLEMRSSEALSPFYTVPYQMAGEWKSHVEGSWDAFMHLMSSTPSLEKESQLSGTFTAHVTQFDHPGMVQETLPLTLSSHFALQDLASLNLLSFTLESPLLDVKGHAQLSPSSILSEIEADVSFHKLSLITPSLEGGAKGSILLNDHEMKCTLLAPDLQINQVRFDKSLFSFIAHKEASIWSGLLDIKGDHPLLGFEASTAVFFDPLVSLSLTRSSIKCLNSWAAGEMVYDLQKESFLQGLASFQIGDLSIFSHLFDQSLSGQAGGSLQLKEEGWQGVVVAKQLKLNEFVSDRIDLDFSHFNFSNEYRGVLNLSFGPSYAYQLYLNSFDSHITWNQENVNYTIEMGGEWKGDFHLFSKGLLSQSPSRFHLQCEEFKGVILDKQFVLQNPCKIDFTQEQFKMDVLDLLIDEGSLLLSSSFNKTKAFFQMKAEHFPLDFLTLLSPRYSLTGLSSFDIELEGDPSSLEGHMSGLLEHANIYPAGNETPIQTKGNIQAHFSKNTLQIHSYIVATDQQVCECSATLPFAFNLNPLSFTLTQDEPLTGQCTVEGHIEQLFDFINLGSQRIGGFLSSRLLLSGTLNQPILNGSLSLQEGFYDNYFIGISLKNSYIEALAEAHKITLQEITLTDGELGSSQMTGIIHLNELFSFSIKGAVDKFRLIKLDWLTTTASGPFIIEGDIEKATVKGDLKLKHGNITIPEQLPFELPILDITLINQPKSHHAKLKYSKPYPIHYDLDLYSEHNLFLSGRGVDAELEGRVHLSGQNLAIVLGGKLETKTGSFSCAGKKFKITNGELLFSESLHFLNMTSHIELPDLSVTVHLRGPLRSPQLIFESSPSLPTSSILARILFNKDIAELSAPQALQLANTIVTLSGNTGPNVLESIRKGLGIDALSFTSSDDANQVFVQIGKYLTEGVLVTLIQGAESSHVKVEVALKAGFALEAETQENNQGKFSLKWNATY
ncbi:translocation/assembly module TamB domain-containing protein [Rhabdochlamydiaceae symbiont of Dictyostelium giganteum]|uniref:translocation/assembly module TamB domain-containing protein n=1 Tax=Rhabdochlamydiaceae symbiont of Dictyostelium giganteum TaxID=3342349 RepID=UPI00384DD98F